MAFGTYRQYDSRWGTKNYNGSSNYATAGCGPTSCANILYVIDSSITPLTTGNWMKSKGYAIRNNGTAWNGIPACLKAFGAQDVRQVDKMADVFSYCSKGYVGVFLFRKGTKGGVTWTTSGHYVAITGYKISNGKHYFKTFDSGGRKHDGWYCYETQMKGLIPRIWLCKIPSASTSTPTNNTTATTEKYSGALPSKTIKKGSKGSEVTKWQKFLQWMGYDLKADGKFGDITKSNTKACQKKFGFSSKDVDGIVGPKTKQAAASYQKIVKKNNTVTPTPTTTTTAPAQSTSLPMKCIDVSYWQGKISQANWEKIKKTCGYAICRASYTSQKTFILSPDSTFATNFTNAKAAGLKVGVYHYSQAVTVDEGKAEAEYLCNILKNYTPTFYVVCDFEFGGRLNNRVGLKASDIANAFCDVVKAHGYAPCIYANTSTLNNYLKNPKYPVWVAQYSSTCTYSGKKVMWQYTSSGRVDGISASNTNNKSANVDLSYVYEVPPSQVVTTPSPTKTVSATTKPTGKYVGLIPHVVLKNGSKNPYVSFLQKFLNWYGIKPALSIDDAFGVKTEEAVKVYQTTEGLTADGVWGSRSCGKADSYATSHNYRIEVDLTNQIATVYDGNTAIISEFVSTAKEGCITPVGNWKIGPASDGRVAKSRTAEMSGGNSYAEYLCRFHNGKCIHTVPYKTRGTDGYVNKGEFNKLGTPRSAGCVRMPNILARFIYENCPIGTAVKVFKGKSGTYPMGKPKKYTATSNIDPTYIPAITPIVEQSTVTQPAKQKYSGTLPSLRVVKNSSQVIADALKWGKWIADSNIYHYGEYGHPTYKTKDNGKYKPIYNVTHSCGCHFCHTNAARKNNKATKLGYNGSNWEYTWVCNTFVTAMYAHGGQEAYCLSRCQKSGAAGLDGKGKSPGLESSKNWQNLGKLPLKDLKAGDVLVSNSHMQCVYAPVSAKKVKIIEATSYVGSYKSSASNNSIRIKEKAPAYVSAYRYIGSINKDISIMHGEYSDRVVLWQKFLNWAGFNCGTPDGKFGDNTYSATKSFQQKYGLTVDGIVGAKSLAKAAEIEK